MKGDSYYYRAIIVSVVEDGDLLLENNTPDPWNGQLAIGKDGLVPKHPIIMPLVSIPFYLLFATPGLLLFNILFSMLLIILIFKLNCLFYDPIIAFITTILYATATLFFDYIYNYSPDVFATMLFLGGLYLTFRNKYYGGAFLLGLSVFAKLPNALLSGIILLYAGFVILGRNATDKNRVFVVITTLVIFFVVLIPFAYTNYLEFGSPIVTGYQRTAVRGANGQVRSVNHMDKFNQPILKGSYHVLFDIGNGVLLTNPVLILAFLGLLQAKRIKPQDKIYLILVICLLQFVIIAKYDEWSTSHFSNRFLMNFVALSSVFTGNFLSYLSHRFSLEPSISEPIS